MSGEQITSIIFGIVSLVFSLLLIIIMAASASLKKFFNSLLLIVCIVSSINSIVLLFIEEENFEVKTLFLTFLLIQTLNIFILTAYSERASKENDFEQDFSLLSKNIILSISFFIPMGFIIASFLEKGNSKSDSKDIFVVFMIIQVLRIILMSFNLALSIILIFCRPSLNEKIRKRINILVLFPIFEIGLSLCTFANQRLLETKGVASIVEGAKGIVFPLLFLFYPDVREIIEEKFSDFPKKKKESKSFEGTNMSQSFSQTLYD